MCWTKIEDLMIAAKTNVRKERQKESDLLAIQNDRQVEDDNGGDADDADDDCADDDEEEEEERFETLVVITQSDTRRLLGDLI
jgi:hypothetical protein